MDTDLRQLLDERAINLVMQTYCHAFDYGPPERWAGVFSEDGVFDVRLASGEPLFRVQGREELTAFRAAYFDTQPRYSKHLYLSPLFDIDGDIARVESYVFVFTSDEGQPGEINSFGKVHDVFVRTADGWRIKERVALTEAMPANKAQHLKWPSTEA